MTNGRPQLGTARRKTFRFFRTGRVGNCLKEASMQTRLSPADPENGKLSFRQIEERIRARAYEVFEERGRADGHALDDWLEAKAEVLGVVKNPKMH